MAKLAAAILTKTQRYLPKDLIKIAFFAAGPSSNKIDLFRQNYNLHDVTFT